MIEKEATKKEQILKKLSIFLLKMKSRIRRCIDYLQTTVMVKMEKPLRKNI